jgi:hypothetical protein
VGKGGGQVTGYNYYIGLHFGIGHGPIDALLEQRAGNLTAWSGAQTTSGSIQINAPNLFGGQQREGGLYGTLDVMMGEATQLANAYLTAQQGPVQPAYRGVTTLVYHGTDPPPVDGVNTGGFVIGVDVNRIPSSAAAGGLIGANNPYPKPWSFKARRNLKGWFNDNPWYSAKAAITMSNGAIAQNAVHILYEVITNPDWGMGYPAAQIDDTNFRAGADQLYSEGFGLCLYWNRQDTIESFIQKIMDYIAGVLVSSPTTGLFQLSLIRGGYDPSTLLHLTANDVVELSEKEDSAITGCTNEMVIRYYDPALKNTQSIILQALGAIQAQGVVVSSVKDYPWIPTVDLAARVAQRELAAVSIPLKRIKVKFNRKLYTMVPGGLFVLTFPGAQLASVVFRVGEVDYGKLTDGAITVAAIQDTFSLPSDTYIQVQESGWVIPDNAPAIPTIYHGMDSGYRDLLLELGATATAALPAGSGYIGLAVARPNGLQYSYAVASAPPPYTTFTARQTAHFTPAATIQSNLGPFDTACTFLSVSDPALIDVGSAAMIIDGSTFEIIRIDAFDAVSGVATIARGCIDSVPAAHAAGIRVFFYDQLLGSDNIDYTLGEVVEAKPLTNAVGQLDISLAPLITMTIVGRAWLPYPVGELKVNGVRWDLVSGGQSAFALTWPERNRLTQAETVIDATAGTITPEAGTTYTVILYDNTLTAFLTTTGITGTGWTWTSDGVHLDIYAKVNTVTAAGTSLQGPMTGLIHVNPPTTGITTLAGVPITTLAGNPIITL